MEGAHHDGGPLGDVMHPQFSLMVTEATEAGAAASSDGPAPDAADPWHEAGDPWQQPRGDSASDSSWTNLPGRWVSTAREGRNQSQNALFRGDPVRQF